MLASSGPFALKSFKNRCRTDASVLICRHRDRYPTRDDTVLFLVQCDAPPARTTAPFLRCPRAASGWRTARKGHWDKRRMWALCKHER